MSWRRVVLCLLACLLTSACAQRDSAGQKWPGGFYAGASGGLSRP